MTVININRWLMTLILVGYQFAVSASTETQPPAELFKQLLEESGLRIESSPGFTDIPVTPNPVFHYEHAQRHSSGALEIRYIIRPLGRLSIDYSDPHNAAPEPNHLFPLLFESLMNELSRGGNTPNREYSQSDARELFNAGWASAAVFDVNPEFSSAYSQALLIGIHKDGLADAYSVFLYNEYSQAKDYIKQTLSSLSFAP